MLFKLGDNNFVYYFNTPLSLSSNGNKYSDVKLFLFQALRNSIRSTFSQSFP